MNRIHKLVWSKTQHRLVVVAEGVRGNRGRKRARRKLAAPLAALTLLATPAWAQLPTGGNVVSGSASISTSGADMTVHQSSQKMIANWQSFSIGKHNSVNFVQPNASAVALNRVTGHNASQILGNLNANGQVFLVNPNGIVIGRGAQVRTGGFVASTLDVSDADFLAGDYRFEGIGGEIRNEGNLEGKVVALIAPTVRNEGTITGDTALAAGTDVLLDFDGDGLLSVEVNASTLQTLVENKGLIQADGGLAILTAHGASEAMKGVVNNSGRIEAQTLAGRNGRVLLLADMAHGEVNAAGELTAKFVETSAATVNIDSALKVDTQGGEWLIDPVDITIDAAKATAIQTALDSGDVTVTTADSGDNGSWGGGTNPAGTDPGDIHINADIAWSAHTLTLNADRDININAVLTASGTSVLVMKTGLTSEGTVKVGFAPGEANGFVGRVNFDRSGTGFLFINGNPYTVINDLTALQAIGTNSTTLSKRYALGSDIDASGTATWNSGAGFVPIGSANRFKGVFDGLGHTINDLSINRPFTDYVGLFGFADNASLRNVGLVGANITGYNNVGGLVGSNFASSSITNAYATGSVTGGTNVGGLVGSNYTYNTRTVSITNAYATGSVSGNDRVGGLVGTNQGDLDGTATITNAYATGSVSATGTGWAAGGLVGFNYAGTNGTASITNAYATGSVTGKDNVGGLVGHNSASSGGTATITNAYATGSVTGSFVNVGGLVGHNSNSAISNGTASITNAYATGSVTGGSNVGGLVGANSGTINASFWDVDTSGVSHSKGGSGRTTAQMQNPFTFIDAGWDFTDSGVWAKSNTGENGGYMMLRSQSGSYYGGYLRVAGNLTRTYGNANPDLSGLTLTTVGTVSGTVDWGSAITASSDAGTYLWSDANMLSLAPGNVYTDLSTGGLTITPRALTVTGDAQGKTYGDADPTLTWSAAGLLFGDTLSGSLDRAAGEDVGDYAIGQGTLTNSNYAITFNSANLTITPAPLTVTANDVSKTYDGSAYSGGNGVTYSGFVNGEDESILSGALAYGGSAQGAVNPGDYAIAVSGLSAGNYVLSFVDGRLSITEVSTGNNERDHAFPESPAFTDTGTATLAAAPALVESEVTVESRNSPCMANGRIMTGAACGSE